MSIYWFLSKAFREASAARKHVWKLLNHQRDILSAPAVQALEGALGDMKAALSKKPDKETLATQMRGLEEVAGKWLKPYPNPAWRENIEVLLVALAVAMGIRTFFLQPFKIPTGSMQPTLYGVTSIPDFSRGMGRPETADFPIPGTLGKLRDWFSGISYIHIVAKEDGELEAVGKPFRLFIFQLWQSMQVGGRRYMIWFPPDYGSSTLEARAGLRYRQPFRKGEDIVRMLVRSGDHLFVDRLSYNFRPPKRGEIIVFETKGIPEENRDRFGIPGDQFYIKRLVSTGGETVSIGADRHLVIDGKRLDSSTPLFNRIYSFDPNQPGRDSHYSGHANDPRVAPYFHEHPEGVKVPPRRYLAMGDNTMNSLDSRAWGPFPAEYVIGKSLWVYWPITERFGLGYKR